MDTMRSGEGKFVPFSLQHDTPISQSPLDKSLCNSARVLFGRFAKQGPLTGYDPFALVEVSSTEVTTTLLTSRKGSLPLLCRRWMKHQILEC